MNYEFLNQCVDELNSLSKEELIITLFDLLSPSEKVYFLQVLIYKYYLKKIYK